MANENDRRFHSASELGNWLSDIRWVHWEIANDAGRTLFERGFHDASRLLGISVDALKQHGLTDEVAKEVSNKLQPNPKQQAWLERGKLLLQA